MSTAQVPSPLPRRALAFLLAAALLFAGGYYAGTRSRPGAAPASGRTVIDPAVEVRVQRAENDVASRLVLKPLTVRIGDRVAFSREHPAGADVWIVTMHLDDGRPVFVAAERIRPEVTNP